MHLASTSISWVQSNRITLPQTSIAPENRPSQKTSSLETIDFQVRTVDVREGMISTFSDWVGLVELLGPHCAPLFAGEFDSLSLDACECQQKNMNLKDKRCSTEY